PPCPAEAAALRIAHQMPAHLLLDPIADVGEAPTRMAHLEVVHPAPKNRVYLLDDSSDRLGPRALADDLELPQERRSLFQLGRVLRPPCPVHAADTTEVKPEESKAFL